MKPACKQIKNKQLLSLVSYVVNVLLYPCVFYCETSITYYNRDHILMMLPVHFLWNNVCNLCVLAAVNSGHETSVEFKEIRQIW